MADDFYTLQEAAAKLNKTEEEVQKMVKEGQLHEFRGDAGDEPEPSFKAADIEALITDGTTTKGELTAKDEVLQAPPDSADGTAGELTEEDEILSAPAPDSAGRTAGELTEEDEILLAPDSSDEESESVGSDTTAINGEGVNVLGEEETDEDYKLADDTMSETKLVPDDGLLSDDTLSATKGTSEGASLEEIEEDVNLDTFGSGSGLLDLSLQADDTSLGGILDEIYTPGSEGEGTPTSAPEASALEVAAEAEQLMPDEGPVAAVEPSIEAPMVIQRYAEPAPDAISNSLGIMLALPLVAVIYTIIVTMAGFNNTEPVIRTAIQSLIWYIAIGAAVASGLIVGTGAMLGGKGGKAVKKEKKAKKPKKEKKKKEKKKKEKKKKGKKGKKAPEAKSGPEGETA